MKDVTDFLRLSLLPAVKALFKVTENMAKAQSIEHANILLATTNNTEKTDDMQKAIRTLNESVIALATPISELVNSINQSNQLQAEQNRLLQEMKDSLTENTARVGTMAISLQAQTKDPGIKALYEKHYS